MTTEAIEIEICLHHLTTSLDLAIETQLSAWGTPLRWSIFKVDPQTQMAKIEAIVVKQLTVDS
jgi:hypothetical protein